MGGCLGAVVLLSFPACSDDHYDIKPGVATASQTIWGNIQATPELDSLAMILQNVKVYSKEEDKNRTMTYAQLLDGTQSFTFWAPLNGTYNAKHYLDQIEEVKALMAEGKTEAANKLEYNIGVQFAQNHMARFNYEANPGLQEVRLFNGKLTSYNAAEALFNGQKLYEPLKNVPSSNGTMHVISGQAPFAYNIYDYFAANSDIFGEVYGTLSDPAIDKKTFSEEYSTPGALNENGQMVYVDSVFVTSNELLNQAYAQIRNEDSLYIAVVPSDAAWTEANEKIGKLFKYAKTYKYNYSNETTKFTNELSLDADSLADYNTKKAMMTSMYFSPSIFGQEFERSDIDGILNYAYYADSLISTNNVIYYNYAEEGQKNPLFGDVEPVVASNGILFPLTSYDYDPSYSFVARQSIDISSSYNVGDVQNSPNRTGDFYNLVEGNNLNDSVDISALGEDKRYRYFQAEGDLDIYIPLPGLYSTKYCIKIMMVPNRADINHLWIDKDTQEEVMQTIRFQSTLISDEGKSIGKVAPDIYVDNDSVKTYTIWDEIEIPKCYVNLPSGTNKCYPLLKLSYPRRYQRRDAPDNVNNPVFALSIAKIIIEPVHE